MNRQQFLRAALAASTAAAAIPFANAQPPADPPRPRATDADKRVLVYGDSNTWGWMPVTQGFPTTRYPDAVRWPGVMAAALGRGHQVSVDGLAARTVDADYPSAMAVLNGMQYNGLRQLPAALSREAPLDLVVLMLGTNDFRRDLERTPAQVAAGTLNLVDTVARAGGGLFTTYTPPAVLVVVPPPMGDTGATPLRDLYDGVSTAKSRELAAAVRAALPSKVAVFDGGSAVRPDGVDGIHFSAANHAAFGRAVAAQVRLLLPAGRGPRSAP